MCFRGDGSHTENAISIANVALAMASAKFTWPCAVGSGSTDPDPVRFRIGVASGPATAGVIGRKRLQYDVWGETVSVASHMEHTGMPGRVHANETFISALKAGQVARYQIASCGEVVIKGKGAVDTWWLEVLTQD